MIKYKGQNLITNYCHNHCKTKRKMINTTTIMIPDSKIQFNKNLKKLFNFNLIYLNMLLKNNFIILLIISMIIPLHTNSISYVSAYTYQSSTTPMFVKTSNLENNTQSPKTTKLNIITSLNDSNNSINNIYNFTRDSSRIHELNNNIAHRTIDYSRVDLLPLTNITDENYRNFTLATEIYNSQLQEKQLQQQQEQWQPLQQSQQNYENSNLKSRLNTGNELWDSLITECYTYPTFSCLQKNVFTYLDKTLDLSNINVTNRLLFIKNKVDYKKYSREVNQQYNMQDKNQQQQQQQHEDEHEQQKVPKQRNEVKTFTEKYNRIDNDNNGNSNDNNSNNNNNADSQYNYNNYYNNHNEINQNEPEYEDESENEIPDEGRKAESPIEEVTNALYDKSIKFAMTHDIELRMPEIMFHGATFKISPRSIEGNGAIVKLELIPKQEIEARETGRIFKKKIQNFIKNKLLLGFLALILVIKLIKIKLFWLLPLLIGIGAAKKLLLKVLLFFFPALAHIFKLCHYYHTNYHQTKFYHHHHLINHQHTAGPPWASEYAVTLPNGPELIFTQPPKSVPHHEYGAPVHDHYDNWESSGPGLGPEYLADNIHRNGQADHFKPKPEDEEDIRSWGLFNSFSGTTIPPTTSQSYKINPFIPKHQSVINYKLRGGGGIPTGGNALYVTPFRRVISSHKTAPPPINLVTAPVPNAAQIAAQYDPAVHHHAVQRAQAKVKEALRIQNEQRLITQQQKILSEEPFAQDGQPIMPKGYDPFYTPILEKMDKIFKQMGHNFDSDHCKERLVCSMYKNPSRYSPHSNFISAELSRDPTELEKPSEMNQSVIKFYRLVQAARDGQEQRDCLRLHPQCSINTE